MKGNWPACRIGAALVELLREAGADQIVVLDVKEPGASVDEFIETDIGNPMLIDAAVTQINAALARRCRQAKWRYRVSPCH